MGEAEGDTLRLDGQLIRYAAATALTTIQHGGIYRAQYRGMGHLGGPRYSLHHPETGELLARWEPPWRFDRVREGT
jgi:hypothetical protein